MSRASTTRWHELREVVDFLKSPKKYQTLGGRIPKGVLLVGPPGTGKTLLAKAIAGEANVSFFSLSGSDFVELFAGVGAARVRDMFRQAQTKAPCIVFIDELDALGKRRGTGLTGGHDEREQTLNALLAEMDGFKIQQRRDYDGRHQPAQNARPGAPPPRPLRSPRSHRSPRRAWPRKNPPRPSANKSNSINRVDIKEIAKITSGFVGADLANLVNEAALLAARANKPAIGMQEFIEGVERITAGLEKHQRIMYPEEKKRIAYHESAHALAAYCLPNTDPVHKVSIIPRGLAAADYAKQRPEGDRYLLTQAELLASIQVLLAGTVAEEMIFGDGSTGAQSDLERATEIARSMVMDYGLSNMGRITYRENYRLSLITGNDDYIRDRSYSEQTAREIDEEIQRIINESLEKVSQVLKTHRPAAGHGRTADRKRNHQRLGTGRSGRIGTAQPSGRTGSQGNFCPPLCARIHARKAARV